MGIWVVVACMGDGIVRVEEGWKTAAEETASLRSFGCFDRREHWIRAIYLPFSRH